MQDFRIMNCAKQLNSEIPRCYLSKKKIVFLVTCLEILGSVSWQNLFILPKSALENMDIDT